MVEPTARRMVADYFISSYQMSERRACRLISLSLSSKRYKARHKLKDETTKLLLMELARAYLRYGYRRLGACLIKKGYEMNHKKVYRLYKEAGLALSRKRSKKLKRQLREPLDSAKAFNDSWSIDFISDSFTDNRKFRCLNVVDDYSRFSIVQEAAISLPSIRVISILKDAIIRFGKPKTIIVDNGPEFRSKEFQAWALREQITIRFIDPGKPMQNAFIESFNGRFRDECLSQHWFSSMQEAKKVIEAWREDYNHSRPHSSLGYLSPSEFIRKERLQNKEIATTCNHKTLAVA